METTVQAYRIEKIIPHDGVIALTALPFEAGSTVQIIVLGTEKEKTEGVAHSHKLKGTIIKYEAPFEPVADNDWDVLQ